MLVGLVPAGPIGAAILSGGRRRDLGRREHRKIPRAEPLPRPPNYRNGANCLKPACNLFTESCDVLPHGLQCDIIRIRPDRRGPVRTSGRLEYRYFRAKRKRISVPPTATEQSPEPLPYRFLERLATILPPERYSAAVSSFSRPRRTAFRLNRLLGASDVVAELAARGLEPAPIEGFEDAWTIPDEQRRRLVDDPAVQDGRIYLQNASSMIPVRVLDPQPGERVMDLAAAPGSKTLQIAGRMLGRGELVAVEVVRKRFFRMRALLERQGATFVRTCLQDGTRVWRYRPGYFDRILLDAPCSTEGRFVTGDPATTRYWSERKIDEMARRQRRLAESAVRCLRSGGVLVYSTCTTAPEENEAVIDWLLSRFPGKLEVEAVDVPLVSRSPAMTGWKGRKFAPDVGKSLRIAPNDTYEAFFVCRIRKC